MTLLTEIINNQTAVHCPTKEQAGIFLSLAIDHGILSYGLEEYESMLNYTFAASKENTCYTFKENGELFYASKEYFSYKGVEVITVFQAIADLKGPSPKQLRIFNSILGERERQSFKHGMPNLKPVVWMAILLEEAGEASKEAVDYEFEPGTPEQRQERLANCRKELIETAAMCFKIIECMDAGMLGE